MSQLAAAETRSRRVPVPTAVPGTTWFGLMVSVWSVFFTLLAVSPETLVDVYDWLTGLALVWEILMWIVLLPWAVAYIAWESSWVEWLRVLVVVLVVVVHLSASVPRVKR